MKVTKYEHACLVIEEIDQKLIIDPGVLTASLPTDIKGVVAIVITHQHGDHLKIPLIQTIISNNPDLTIFAPQDTLDLLQEVTVKKELAQPEVSHTSGSFALDFYGSDHAIIHESVPCQNVGVMVNKLFYYPGDSFTEPKSEVTLLALPSGAPWMKVGEAMEYLKKVMPHAVFPTHNAVYSEAGNMFSNTWLEQQATTLGASWRYLLPGDSIET